MRWPWSEPDESAAEEKTFTVQLSSGDTHIERAEKIWRLLGFANDRLGMVAKLAGYLATYKQIDERYAAQNLKSEGK